MISFAEKTLVSMSYNPDAALEFFKLYGKPEAIPQDELICVQGEKANRLLLQQDKMYLLLQGTVAIQIAGKVVALLQAGDIFGELTPLIQSERSASVIAKTPCRIVSLTEKQLSAGLKVQPEFAFTLMSLLAQHLRQAIAEAKSSALSGIKNTKRSSHELDAKTLQQLRQELGSEAIRRILKRHVIFQEGGTGMLMYVILEGSVVVSIGNKVVGHCGTGAVIGELALIDQKERTANVIAETDCLLLAVDRKTFLELIKTQPVFALSLLRALAARVYLYRTGYSYTPAPFFSGF